MTVERDSPQVRFTGDEEPLTLAGLDAWSARDEVVASTLTLLHRREAAALAPAELQAALESQLARLRRSGVLPLSQSPWLREKIWRRSDPQLFKPFARHGWIPCRGGK